MLITSFVILFVVIWGVFAYVINTVVPRPEGCTCPKDEYKRISATIVRECPVHGDGIEFLYPLEEIKFAAEREAAFISEREQACLDAGLEWNKLLKEKWGR